MNKFLMIMLATMFSASGAFVLAAEEPKPAVTEVQPAAESASTTPSSADTKTSEVSAPATAATDAVSVSLWQRIKNFFSPSKDAPVTVEKAQDAAANQENAAAAGVLAAPVSQEQKTPEPGAQVAPVTKETTTAEEGVLVTSETGTSTETKSLWKSMVALLVSPQLDLRVKIGSAAELNKLSLYGTTYSGSGASSDNLQVEANFGFSGQSNIGFIASAGVFKRQHSGSAVVSSIPTSVDYDATGITLGAGVAWRAHKKLHVEGKFEIGMGTGQPTFYSPGDVWNQSKADGYGSYSIILGGYYTFRDPGFQLGLELGTHSFTGNYSIMTNAAQWIDEKVSGNSSTANLLAGYRF